MNVKEEAPPKYYPVKLVWTGGKSGNLIVEGKATIRTGVPSGGPEEAVLHSPEDLFVSSATMCYMNGFVEFTKKMRIEFNSFECDSVGTLEKVGRSFEVTKIVMKAKVGIGSEDIRKKIERALDLAARYCFIANSMKSDVSHETTIVVE